MALSMDYDDGTTVYTGAYFRVLNVSCATHSSINIVLAVYVDEQTRRDDPGSILTILNEGTNYQETIDGTNPIAQSYALLKQSSFYSTASDA